MPSSLRSPNLIKKRRKRKILKSIFFLASLAALIIGPSIITKSDYLEIDRVVVDGNSVIKSEGLISVASEKMNGNYFYLYSKKNFVLYPRDAIKEEILTKHKRIKEVSLKISRITTLNILVEERIPAFLWCDNSGKCFFVDQQGFIFDISPNFSSDIYFTFKGGVDGEPIGQKIFEEEKFSEIINFINSLKALSLFPDSINIDGENLEIHLSEDSSILIRVDDEFDRALSNIESILNDPKLELVGGKNPNFSYLDLRFGNKVFYKKSE